MNKKVTIGISAMGFLVLATIGIEIYESDNKQPILYHTEQVHISDIAQSVTATGTIEPVTEVAVGTQVSGIIDHIYADYNSVVSKGQLIAEMDKVMLQSELESAKASYDGCKAEYIYQQKNYERNKSLHKKGLVSDTEYELVQYNYEKAKSAYDSSRASLSKAKRNLSYATITSPIDGVVISRDVEEGQTVASGFETPTLFTIAADLTQMQVIADVDEADIGDVKVGQRVEFTVDAYPLDTFVGEVKQIRLGSTLSSSNTTTSSESVVTYEVVISAQNPDMKLKPRLTANITIYTLDKKGVLSVSNKALRFQPKATLLGANDIIINCKEEDKLWTRQGKTFTAHPVNIGISNGIRTEIISGITEGMEVITEATLSPDQQENNLNANKQNNMERSPFTPGPPKQQKHKK